MASFYQKATGLRKSSGTGRNENVVYWPSANEEVSSHHRGGSDPRHEQVAVVPNRSRSYTMNTAMSFYAASTSDSSTASRAPSPHLTTDKHIPTLEKRDNSAKTLLSKGSRMLRKHGSKFSLSSLYTVDSDTSEKYVDRLVTAHTGTVSGTKSRHNGVEAVKREELKRTISEPFDFQHVTHTDRVFLNSIQRVPKTELVGEFSALRAGQASKPQLRGIRAEALPVQRPNDSPPISPVSEAENVVEPNLPETPPRPKPPPKDAVSPLSPKHHIRMSRSVDSFSRPVSSSGVSPVTPPRRHSSRRALQPSLVSPMRPLGAYTYSQSHSTDAHGADSPEDLCENCGEVCAVCAKPLPGLPPIHAVTTNDDSARQLRVVPLPRILPDLADVPEEDELRRQSLVRPQGNNQPIVLPGSTNHESTIALSPTREGIGLHESKAVFSNETVVLDDWDDAIDYSWDHAAEPEVIDAQSPASMKGQVATFVDKATTRLAGAETNADPSSNKRDSAMTKAQSTKQLDPTPQSGMLSISTRELSSPNRSGSSPLLGLGIEVEQPWQEILESCATPTPGTASVVREANERDSTLTTSFHSDFGPASVISKSSSQESILWSIASSIMGTSRSSNSSNSLLEQLPDYPRGSKSIDDLKEALESVQEHLQEIHEEQSVTDYPVRHSSPPGAQPHRRARSLATGFMFGSDSKDMPTPQPTNSNSVSPRTSYGHSRVPSGSRIPIPARMSSVKDQPEINRPLARRMRSATTNVRSRPPSRASASYSLFPGASAIGA
jgi:hypothetical protein